MKRRRIEFKTDETVPLWVAAGILQGVGTPELARGFLRTFQKMSAASHCTIFALEERGGAAVVSAASSYGDAASVTAQEYIRQGFDREDSNMVWLARRKAPRQGQAWLSLQSADEVGNLDYRRICYGDNAIRERMSVLLLLEGGRRIAVSFYRGLACEPFAPRDLDNVERCAPLLLAAVVAHLRVATASPRSTPLRSRILAQLPHRERQVVTCTLDGHTTRETAGLLKIAPTTVLTYRYRAFRKLGVRTHRELLRLADQGTVVGSA